MHERGAHEAAAIRRMVAQVHAKPALKPAVLDFLFERYGLHKKEEERRLFAYAEQLLRAIPEPRAGPAAAAPVPVAARKKSIEQQLRESYEREKELPP